MAYADEIRSVSECDGDEVVLLVTCYGSTYAFTKNKYFIELDVDFFTDQNVVN